MIKHLKVVTSAGEFLGRTLLVATLYSRSWGSRAENFSGGVFPPVLLVTVFFRNKTVAVISGGERPQEPFFNGIVQGDLHRRNNDTPVRLCRMKFLTTRVEFIWEFHREEKLRSITIENIKEQRFPKQWMMHFICWKEKVPNTGFLKEKMDGQGYIITNEEMDICTGVYAAGDIGRKFLRQVITAAADDAIAATMAYVLKERHRFQGINGLKGLYNEEGGSPTWKVLK